MKKTVNSDKKDYYFEMKINEYKVIKPKKISNSEHRKRKKPESKERTQVNAKTRKMSFLVILLVAISDSKVKTVEGFNPRCTKLDHEIVYKSFSLEQD